MEGYDDEETYLPLYLKQFERNPPSLTELFQTLLYCPCPFGRAEGPISIGEVICR